MTSHLGTGRAVALALISTLLTLGLTTWQGNRNPFIDHPQWAESIW